MERFAFKIDSTLKAKLYKICRLCGIDNPPKVPILSQTPHDDDDDELPLRTKIEELLGLHVAANDKMPQCICTLCMDKVNDFFEFRAMCVATNVQTRKLLGLKEEVVVVQPISTPAATFEETMTGAGKRRGRKRKSDDIKVEPDAEQMPLSVQGAEKKARLVEQKQIIETQLKLLELEMVKPKKEIAESKKTKGKNARFSCGICSEGFPSEVKLCKHISNVHVPDVPRYHCTACNETLRKGADIKNHQFWHKLSQTPFKCDMCSETRTTLYTFTKHIRTHLQEFKVSTFDRNCAICLQTFPTSFLYNEHFCVRQSLQCGGCGQRVNIEEDHVVHTANCSACYDKPIPNMPLTKDEPGITVKNESEDINDPPYVGPSGKTRKSLSAELQRVENLFQKTMDTLVSMKHEPEVHIKTEDGDCEASGSMTIDDQENEDYEQGETDDRPVEEEEGQDDEEGEPMPDGDGDEPDDADEDDVTDSGFQQDDDTQSDRTTGLDIMVPIVSIKTEPGLESNGIESSSVVALPSKTAPTTKKLPTLRLKIKKEHGALNASFTDDLPKKNSSASSKNCQNVVKREVITPPPPLSPSIPSPSSPIPAQTQTPTAPDNSLADIVPPQPLIQQDIPQSMMEGGVRIKEEPLDNDDIPVSSTKQRVQSSNVMTFIPGSQMSMSNNDDEEYSPTVESNTNNTTVVNEYQNTINTDNDALDEDVKPSREELNQLLHRSGNISMAMNTLSGMPRITAVSSGTEVAFNPYSCDTSAMPSSSAHHEIRIKPEPCYDQGYQDTLNSSRGLIRIKQELDVDEEATNGQEENEDEEDEQETPSYTVINPFALAAKKRIEGKTKHKNTNIIINNVAESVDTRDTNCNGNDVNKINDTANSEIATESSTLINTHTEDDTVHFEIAKESSTLVNAHREVHQSEEIQPSLNETPFPRDNTKELEANLEMESSASVSKVGEFSKSPKDPITQTTPEVILSESVVDEIVGCMEVPKELSNCAQPFSEPIDNAMECGENETGTQANSEHSESLDEEQQNVLNHCITGTAINNQSNPEIVDNIFNEIQQELHEEREHVVVSQPTAPFAPTTDEGNVNEIAENNNNANIERELQDDTLV